MLPVSSILLVAVAVVVVCPAAEEEEEENHINLGIWNWDSNFVVGLRSLFGDGGRAAAVKSLMGYFNRRARAD